MHPEDRKYSRQARKWYDPRVALLLSSKGSAKTRNLTHTITKEDITIPINCPVLGLKLTKRGRTPSSMTLDRIDSTKGYIPGNICVISWRANKLKSDGTLEELSRVVDYMRSHL